MEESLTLGGLVVVIRDALNPDEVAAAKKVGTLQRRKFLEFPDNYARAVSGRSTWP